MRVEVQVAFGPVYPGDVESGFTKILSGRVGEGRTSPSLLCKGTSRVSCPQDFRPVHTLAPRAAFRRPGPFLSVFWAWRSLTSLPGKWGGGAYSEKTDEVAPTYPQGGFPVPIQGSAQLWSLKPLPNRPLTSGPGAPVCGPCAFTLGTVHSVTSHRACY